jgi:hypothetical protein
VLELPQFASIIDGNFFFTPFLVPVEEHPFVGDTRVFPVDFNFVFRNRHQIRVMLPADMTVADVPRNIYQTMQEGKFTRKVIAEGNEIHIMLDLDIKRASYPTMVYADIKEMFDIMSQSCMDQVLAVAAAVEAGGQ